MRPAGRILAAGAAYLHSSSGVAPAVALPRAALLEAAERMQGKQVLDGDPAAPGGRVGRGPAAVCLLLGRQALQPIVQDVVRDTLACPGLGPAHVGEEVVAVYVRLGRLAEQPIQQGGEI